ncbi:MAG: DUF262 domain-containing HNH endonuclease family protein [Bryobacterales bacterium]|nr:DUF262 domain-containing HNH endonuclease family protein [Bryobacterales bacterium]
MEPRKYALAEVFEGRLVYVVPNYQRLYVWNREDQWDPLWSDVAEIADELIREAARRDSTDINAESGEPHFMGAVVLKISGSTPDMARRYRVIDGQQRLTTLQLLMAAAIAELEETGLSDPATRLRELTVNSSSSTAPATMSYKISHYRDQSSRDYGHFNDVIDVALDQGNDVDIQGPMAECYRFFRKSIKNWISSYHPNTNTAAMALSTTLVMKLEVVGIYLDRHEKEHIIFETLNARGEPLTEWDKIKNYLLYRADIDQSLNQESFFEKYLDQFDDPWWRQAAGRGPGQRPRSDVFTDYWLESMRNTPVSARRVFREFQKYVNEYLSDQSQHLDGLMAQFIRDSQYFKKFEQENGSDSSRELLFHKRRLDLSIGAIWPLLLRLQRNGTASSNYDQCLAVLESYFVRRKISGYQARSYDQVAIDLLNALSSDNDIQGDLSEILARELRRYAEVATLWPSDAEVRTSVLKNHHSRYTQRLVLTALEKHLIGDLAGVTTVDPSVQIEHLMPSGWQPESWPLPGSVDPLEAESERDQAVQTFGNLTLLNGRLNASISNGPWIRKRLAIKKSDNLFLNRRLLEESGDDWTENDIYQRSEWMYRAIIEIWPRER